MKMLNMLDKEVLDSEDVQRELYLKMKEAIERSRKNKYITGLGVVFMNIKESQLAIMYDGNGKYAPFSFTYKSHDISVEVLASLKELEPKKPMYEIKELHQEAKEEFSTWKAMISLDVGKHIVMNEGELNLFIHDLKKYGEYQENFRIITEMWSSFPNSYIVYRTYLRTPCFRVH